VWLINDDLEDVVFSVQCYIHCVVVGQNFEYVVFNLGDDVIDMMNFCIEEVVEQVF